MDCYSYSIYRELYSYGGAILWRGSRQVAFHGLLTIANE